MTTIPTQIAEDQEHETKRSDQADQTEQNKPPADMAKRLDAATHVFLEKGFSATTVDEIATAAKASKVTFYKHFGNKDELFETVVIRLNERIHKLSRLHLKDKSLLREGSCLLPGR